MTCLRAANVSLLDTANKQISAGSLFGTVAFLPVVDGSFIVERPTETLKKGHINGVTFQHFSSHYQLKPSYQEVLLSVTNAHEGLAFVNMSAITNIRDYVVQLFPVAPTSIIDTITRKYQALGGTPADQAVLIMGECKSSFSKTDLIVDFPQPALSVQRISF
jgi:carboxylesterase type B